MVTGSGPNNTEGIGKPFVPQANVVINGAFDRLEIASRVRQGGTKSPWNAMEDETHVIKRHDLVFKMRPKPSGMIGSSLGDPPLKLFGSANGLSVASGVEEQLYNQLKDRALSRDEEIKIRRLLMNKLRGRLKWVGVALPDHDPRRGDNQSVGMAVCVGGTQTVVNTGDKIINAFDTVMWDLPDFMNKDIGGRQTSGGVTPYGAPSTKATFQTKPYSRREILKEAGLQLNTLPDYRQVGTLGNSSADSDVDEDTQVVAKCLKCLVDCIVDPKTINLASSLDVDVEEQRAKVYTMIQTAHKTGGAAANGGSVINSLMTLAQFAFGSKLSADSRVIGTALSTAKPGEPLHLMIGRAPGASGAE